MAGVTTGDEQHGSVDQPDVAQRRPRDAAWAPRAVPRHQVRVGRSSRAEGEAVAVTMSQADHCSS